MCLFVLFMYVCVFGFMHVLINRAFCLLTEFCEYRIQAVKVGTECLVRLLVLFTEEHTEFPDLNQNFGHFKKNTYLYPAKNDSIKVKFWFQYNKCSWVRLVACIHIAWDRSQFRSRAATNYYFS